MDDRPFSIDLVGAVGNLYCFEHGTKLNSVRKVIRQGSFIDKMTNFGWTDPGYFEEKEDEVVLVHCIARYHACVSLLVQKYLPC